MCVPGAGSNQRPDCQPPQCRKATWLHYYWLQLWLQDPGGPEGLAFFLMLTYVMTVEIAAARAVYQMEG